MHPLPQVFVTVDQVGERLPDGLTLRVSDEGTKPVYESSDDAYRVFHKILESSHPPDTIVSPNVVLTRYILRMHVIGSFA